MLGSLMIVLVFNYPSPTKKINRNRSNLFWKNNI